jgi:hypothetical protein
MMTTYDAYHGFIMRGTPAAAATYGVNPGDQMSFFEYGGQFRFYEKNNTGSGVLNEIARIDKSNSFFNSNVGIGTTSPSTSLHVVKDASWEVARFEADSYPTATVYSQAAAKYAQLNIYDTRINSEPTMELRADTPHFNIRLDNTGNVLTIRDSGNVGIGTTSPSYKLDVVGDIIINDTSDPTLYMRRNDGTPVSAIMLDTSTDNIIIGATNMDELIFKDDSGEGMRLDGSGNLGIGTTAPLQKLHVSGGKALVDVTSSVGTELILQNLAVDQFAADKNYHEINFITSSTSSETTGGYVRIKAGQEVSGNDNRSYLGFWTAPDDGAVSEKMRIASDGNVGIGTASPGSLLQVGDAGTAPNGLATLTLTGANTAPQIASKPGLYHRHSIGLGVFSDYAISFQVNGFTALSDAMIISNTGNVGIGTTSPSYKLDVVGSARLSDSLYVGGNKTSGATLIQFNNYDAALVDQDDIQNIIRMNGRYWSGSNNQIVKTEIRSIKDSSNGNGGSALGFATQIGGDAPVEHMRINRSGNVGIGTSSPTPKLHLVYTGGTYSADATSGFINQADTGRATMRLRSIQDEASEFFFDVDGGIRWDISARPSSQGHSLNFYPQAATPQYGLVSAHTFQLSQNGDVIVTGAGTSGRMGIGTTSPTQKLDVNGDIAVKGASVINKASAALTIGDTAGTDSVTNLTLTTAGRNTEVFLDDAGNVGINTATPSYNLTVDSGTNDIGILTASSDSGSYVGFLDNSTSTIPKIGAVGNKLILDASQYVGIKRTDPSYALDVSGTIRATGDVIAYSDARVKENVETIPNALDKVKSMRGVGYNKIGEEKRSIGVIAQEMLDVIPEVVHTDDQGMHSVAYGNLVGVLIEAMKEQQAQIDELKAQLDGIAK